VSISLALTEGGLLIARVGIMKIGARVLAAKVALVWPALIAVLLSVHSGAAQPAPDVGTRWVMKHSGYTGAFTLRSGTTTVFDGSWIPDGGPASPPTIVSVLTITTDGRTVIIHRDDTSDTRGGGTFPWRDRCQYEGSWPPDATNRVTGTGRCGGASSIGRQR